EVELDVAVPLAEQHERRLYDLPEVIGGYLDGRQPRERREFVDQPLQLLDLSDDRVRTLGENGALLRPELVSISLLQPLRRELNRRQWVLDLMRDSPRDFTPR